MKIIISLVVFCEVVFFCSSSYSRPLHDSDSAAYFEGFESVTFPPTGWQAINVSGNVIWMIGYWAHTGAQATVCAWQATGVGEDWLITPRWNTHAGDSLAFWLRPFFVGHPPDSLVVRVSTTDSLLTSFATRILYLAEGNGYPTSTVYQRYAVSLNQFAGQGIFVAFKHMDQNGDGIFIDDVSVVRLGPSVITGSSQIPSHYELFQNYPNPFNPSTSIHYALPQTSFVTLTVCNTLGQQVAQLVNEQQQAGYHDVEFRGDGLASGVYFYRIQAGHFVASKKLLLLK